MLALQVGKTMSSTVVTSPNIQIAVIIGWAGYALDEHQGCEVIRPWHDHVRKCTATSQEEFKGKKGRFFYIVMTKAL